MEEIYKDHEIKASAWQIAHTRQWKPHVIILWKEGGTTRIQPFTLNNHSFSSVEEAQESGLSFARKWIDDGKPDFSLPLDW
jgi:hypothetical protein